MRTGGQASTRVRSACSRQTMSSSTAKRQHHPLRRTYIPLLTQGRNPSAITVLGSARRLLAWFACFSFGLLSTGLVLVNAKATRALFLHFLASRLYLRLYLLRCRTINEINCFSLDFIALTCLGSEERSSACKKPKLKQAKKKAKKTPPSRNKKSTKQHQHLFFRCPQLKPASPPAPRTSLFSTDVSSCLSLSATLAVLFPCPGLYAGDVGGRQLCFALLSLSRKPLALPGNLKYSASAP